MTESDSETAEATTILARLRAAGIGDERARNWIEQGAVKVAGAPVSDVDVVVPWPPAWTLAPA